MTKRNAVVATCKSHDEAEAALKSLQRSGFESKQLSIVGRDCLKEEHVVGDYNTGDRMKFWGKMGAFCGAFLGFLIGSAFFLIPGFGVGALVGMIVGALEGGVAGGVLCALGAGLLSVCFYKDSIMERETALKSGKFVVIAHSSAGEMARAREIISRTNPEILAEPELENADTSVGR